MRVCEFVDGVTGVTGVTDHNNSLGDCLPECKIPPYHGPLGPLQDIRDETTGCDPMAVQLWMF